RVIPPSSTLFPPRRSSDLVARYIKGELTTADITEGTYVRDWASAAENATKSGVLNQMTADQRDQRMADLLGMDVVQMKLGKANLDRKSTRLNSSHQIISYP